MKYVVDASVAVKWFVPESHSTEAVVLIDGTHELHAPELIIAELGNILWRKHKQQLLASSVARQIVRKFRDFDIIFHSHQRTSSSAFVGAELSGQTVYDWTYLALAASLSCSFVTADAKFYRALETTSMKKYLVWVGDL